MTFLLSLPLWVALDPVRTMPEEFENGCFHSEIASNIIRLRYAGKTQQSPVTLDLCLGKTRVGKSHDHRDVIVFKNLRVQYAFRPH